MHKYTIYTLTILGTFFSGYLSGVKFFTNTCALGETCPLFLGHPACYFGFGMFLALFILSNFLVFRKAGQVWISSAIQLVSILGIIFAGRFVVNEFIQWSRSGFEWFALGLPTCAYGLIFYMLVLVFILRHKRSSKPSSEFNNQ